MPRKLLIIGAQGMLGHQLLRSFASTDAVVGAVRRASPALARLAGNLDATVVEGIDALSPATVERLVSKLRPDVVFNCVGIIKQLSDAKNPLVSIPINALFPHQLAEICEAYGARMIHFSTDCVFSGAAGRPYSETDTPDARDLYGRSKLLGEVNRRNSLTLRTSIIGHELDEGSSLIAWILSQKGGQASGFARALYTGVTTVYMAEALRRVLDEAAELHGVWHFSADPISKFDLVELVNEIYGLGVTVDRNEDFVCDRRLDSTLFRSRTGITPPSWRDMITAMRRDHLLTAEKA